eukprot:tig00000269_g23746.t1
MQAFPTIISVPSDAPFPPSAVQIIAFDSRSVVIFVELGYNGGSDIKSVTGRCAAATLTLQAPDVVASSSVLLAPGTRLIELNVSGLVPATEYNCSASAANSVGESDGSSPVQLRTAAEPPSPPAAVTVAVANSRSLRFSVRHGSDGGSPILNFTLSCRLVIAGDNPASFAETTVPVPVGATDGIGQLDKLIPGRPYACAGFVINAVGASPSTAAFPAIVDTPPELPAAPAAVSTRAASSRVVAVSIGFGFDGGSALLEVIASCVRLPEAACPEIRSAATTIPATGTASLLVNVSGLWPASEFRCSAHVRNDVGASPPSSAAITVQTPAEEPAAPQSVEVVAASSTVLQARIAPGYDGGSAITSCIVTCRTRDATTASNNSSSVSAASVNQAITVEKRFSPSTLSDPILVNVTGLRRATGYACSAQLANDVGPSPSVEAAPQRTLLEAPGRPTVLVEAQEATVGLTSTNLRVTIADNGGSNAVAVRADCASTSDSVSAGPVGIAVGADAYALLTVRKLTSGLFYCCSVYTENEAGRSPDRSVQIVLQMNFANWTSKAEAQLIDVLANSVLRVDRSRIRVAGVAPGSTIVKLDLFSDIAALQSSTIGAELSEALKQAYSSSALRDALAPLGSDFEVKSMVQNGVEVAAPSAASASGGQGLSAGAQAGIGAACGAAALLAAAGAAVYVRQRARRRALEAARAAAVKAVERVGPGGPHSQPP